MSEKHKSLASTFASELIKACLTNEYILSSVSEHVESSYLPNKDYDRIVEAMGKYYRVYRKIPPVGIIEQQLSAHPTASKVFGEIANMESNATQEEVLEQLERYIKQVEFQKSYQLAGKLYNEKGFEHACKELQSFSEWVSEFSLQESDFVDVISTFKKRFYENRERRNAAVKLPDVNRFYIDALDNLNNGRSLRGQLSCFLASTGVGKSHIARWIGKSACQLDGLNVLHFQLEGSKEEVVNAYSASLAVCSAFRYESGTLRDAEVERMNETLQSLSGTLHVKAYPRFNTTVTPMDIYNSIQAFKKKHGVKPDIVIVDSIDLLSSSRSKGRSEASERFKRIDIMNDLKDIASDEQIWVVGTYQSTIENQEFVNDETKVLTEYNSSESKGIARPVTHLITLNRSDKERKEETMRLYVAKSRFFPKGDTIKIATDYENEQFYDKHRTITLDKRGGGV